MSTLGHASSRAVSSRHLSLTFPSWARPACALLGVLRGQGKVRCALLGACIWRLCGLGVELKVLTRLGLA